MSSDTITINKNKLIATTISIIVFGLLLVLLLYYSILSPDTSTVTQSGGIEIGFNGLEQSGIAQKFSEENNSTRSMNEKTDLKSNSTVIIPTSDKTSAELVRDKFFENKEKSISTNGNQRGEKAGDPKGNNTNNPIGLSSPETNFTLTGRSIESQPTLSKDTKEEGKVVVEITVDKAGNVIKADPNGRGTTTSSSVLKDKAKQTALTTKFSISNIEEQKGTIIIIFSF